MTKPKSRKFRKAPGVAIALALCLFAIGFTPTPASAAINGLNVNVAGGSLTIIGNGGDNSVEVVPLDDGTGTDTHVPGAFTIYSGGEVMEVTGVTKDIKIFLKGGNDAASVGGVEWDGDGSWFGTTGIISGDIRIFGDSGNDDLQVFGMTADDILMKGGSGDDGLGINAVNMDDVIVRGQGGEDWYYGEWVTADRLDVNIAAGGGGISLDLSSVNRLKLRAGAGDSHVRLGENDDLGTNPQINTANGEDSITLGSSGYDWTFDAFGPDAYNNEYAGKMRISTGSNDDRIDIYQFRSRSAVRQLDVRAGSGNDNLDISYSLESESRSEGGRVDGQSGDDTIDYNSGPIPATVDFRNWETTIGGLGS